MASVDDVAAAVLERTGPIDTFKLQKLVYYCQAWHLVWERRPLFQARVEAWANGPVVRKLYGSHRGRYRVESWPQGDPSRLRPEEVTTVDAVVKHYNKFTGAQLAELTHAEQPWKGARAGAGLGPGEPGSAEILPASMLEYYESLV